MDLEAGVAVEPTYFPAPVGQGARHAIEVVDAGDNTLACFQLGEVVGYAIDPPGLLR